MLGEGVFRQGFGDKEFGDRCLEVGLYMYEQEFRGKGLKAGDLVRGRVCFKDLSYHGC